MNVPSHRAQLSELLAGNPNYFGNLPESGLSPVTELLADTSWEELTGVGYNADREELEATIDIKLDSGYGGGLCTAGSWEYVRFWVNTGSGWEDAGLAGVNVHDLPEGTDCTGAAQLPVSYIARMSYQPARDFCGEPLLPQVRAILSWSVPPPPTGGAPQDWTPIFGNVVNDYIQIPPRLLILADALAAVNVSADQLPPNMTASLDVPIPAPAPDPLSLATLAASYGSSSAGEAGPPAGLTVPAHRFAAATLASAAAAPVPDQDAILATIGTWNELGLDWPSAVTSLLATGGNTEYEQIDCVGLDLALPRLVATITIKQPVGYNGGLCTAGSTEYVAFWADLGPDCVLTYLGTQQISVHDIASIPPEGLNYAAVLPVDLSAIQRPCSEPLIIRVRAVLSWAVPPSTTDPYAIPYWGNALDAHVQVPVLAQGAGTGPNIFAIGGIGVASIDSSYNPVTMATSGSGLTLPGANFAFTGLLTSPLACPFGGEVTINGVGVPGGSYRVQVRDLSAGPGPWITVTNPVAVVSFLGVTSTNVAVGEYFPYLPNADNELQALADWYPPAQNNDLWEIKLDALDSTASPLGEVRYRIQLDNTPPVCDIHIDSGGDCKTFADGSTITGHVYAVDPQGYPGSYSIWIEPQNLPGGIGVLTPASPVTGQTGPEPGNPWQLITTGMSACAYTVQVQAVNRVIVDSSTVGLYSGVVAVGFSLS
jgi:hypothetical protein